MTHTHTHTRDSYKISLLGRVCVCREHVTSKYYNVYIIPARVNCCVSLIIVVLHILQLQRTHWENRISFSTIENKTSWIKYLKLKNYFYLNNHFKNSWWSGGGGKAHFLPLPCLNPAHTHFHCLKVKLHWLVHTIYRNTSTQHVPVKW